VIIPTFSTGSRCRNTAERHSKGQVRVSASEQPWERATLEQLEAIRRRAGAERYLGDGREVGGARYAAEAPRPLEYDANGFPVPQRGSSYNRRVARLLNPL
jgi:hypothetical protein